MIFESLEKQLAVFAAFMSMSKRDVTTRMRVAHAALCWYWVHWHATQDLKAARAKVIEIVQSAITSLPPREKDDQRPTLDSFLIQLAVIAGNPELTKKVCGVIVTASPSTRSYQHIEAWNGVLKWTILNDQSKAEEQFRVMQRHSPLRLYEWPPHPLVEAFLKRDWTKFRKAYKARSDLHDRAAKKEGALHHLRNQVIINVKRKHMNFLWPWPTAVFGRLAVLQGARLDFDTPWLPQAFLH
jgi:hypothetical protein